MFSWFSSTTSVRFGEEMAAMLLSDLAASSSKDDKKFAARTEKTLLRIEQRLGEFKRAERLNVYKKAKLANAFLWALRDKGCPDEYAHKLTEWLSARL